jgi:hypothetical protein
MKKVGVVVLVFCACYFGILSSMPGAVTEEKSALVIYDVFILDTLTVYNPIAKQCDRDPLITASNKKINLHELRSGEIHWMALSRNMLRRWGGQLNYGDTIYLQSGDANIDGKWVIQDTMNKKFTNRGDLLFDVSRTKGMWRNVKMVRSKKYTATPHQL